MIKKIIGYIILISLLSLIFGACVAALGFALASLVWTIAGVMTFLFVVGIKWALE